MQRPRFSKLVGISVLSLAFVAAPLSGVSFGQADTGTGTTGGSSGGGTTTSGGGATGGGATGGGYSSGATANRAEENDTDWGWLGLLGLLGLAGLARRKDHTRVHTDTGATRH